MRSSIILYNEPLEPMVLAQLAQIVGHDLSAPYHAPGSEICPLCTRNTYFPQLTVLLAGKYHRDTHVWRREWPVGAAHGASEAGVFASAVSPTCPGGRDRFIEKRRKVRTAMTSLELQQDRHYGNSGRGDYQINRIESLKAQAAGLAACQNIQIQKKYSDVSHETHRGTLYICMLN